MCSKAEEKSKVVCKICGSELKLTKKNHYVATDNLKTGAIVTLAATKEQWYDAFDCPVCGCQYIAGERKRKVRNVIFRELQEDLVSDNVIEEDSFDVLDEPKEDIENKKVDCTLGIPLIMSSCFGKELKDADEECIGCEELKECLAAPECFGKFKEMMHVKERCTMCNMEILNKCREVSRTMLKEESLEEPSKEQIEKEIELAKKQGKTKAYPICIGDQELVEENGEECRTCDSREECVKRIKESNEQIGKEWEDIWDDDEEF